MVDKLVVNKDLAIPLGEIEWTAVRSQGAGGQNVNKVATAIHLRFDARNSPSLPEAVVNRLLELGDHRVTAEGIVVIKAKESRSQARNRDRALERLAELLGRASEVPKPRKPTRPSAGAKARRREDKQKRSQTKDLRGRPRDD